MIVTAKKGTYLKRIYHTAFFIWAAAALLHCNIEVGNPDSNLPESAQSIQTLSFSLSSGSACETSNAACISVPVVSGDPQQPAMTYELTHVRFQLAEIQLLPNAREPISAELDLLNGSTVTLGQSKDARSLVGLSLRFASRATGGASTFSIDGNFVTVVSGERLVIPLSITFPDAILAETAIVGAEPIDGVIFNAASWFDFTDVDLTKVIKDLTSGACKDPAKPACLKHREKIAEKISTRISGSLSIKTKKEKKNSISKEQ